MNARAAARAELSRETIVDRALEIADSEGTGAITIRRIAKEFAVTPMALYWHVQNKDELLAAMGDRFFDDLPPLVDSGPWSQRLRSVVMTLVESLRRHPASAHLAAARALQCPPGRQYAEDVLAMLIAAGFSNTEASDIARTALQTAIMLVSQQAGAEPDVAEAERESVRAAKRDALASLPADRYPNLVACADALTACDDPDTYFEFGVDLFVAGVDRLQSTRRRQSRKA
ncbi:MAG TPA: TetR family transcriptional regulator [Jatrophihabitantaceae bacterium]|nr:TetR family transcriptional regulator [Jatrophihabitantaceae bacterium]